MFQPHLSLPLFVVEEHYLTASLELQRMSLERSFPLQNLRDFKKIFKI